MYSSDIEGKFETLRQSSGQALREVSGIVCSLFLQFAAPPGCSLLCVARTTGTARQPTLRIRIKHPPEVRTLKVIPPVTGTA